MTLLRDITVDAITEDAIRAKVTAKSFARGVDYYRQGAVAEATRRGNRLFARVRQRVETLPGWRGHRWRRRLCCRLHLPLRLGRLL